MLVTGLENKLLFFPLQLRDGEGERCDGNDPGNPKESSDVQTLPENSALPTEVDIFIARYMEECFGEWKKLAKIKQEWAYLRYWDKDLARRRAHTWLLPPPTNKML